MKPKPQLKLAAHNDVVVSPAHNQPVEPTTPKSQMIVGFDSPPSFHPPPSTPSSPVLASSLPDSPVTPSSSVVWKHHDPSPLILTSPSFEYEDPILKFSKSTTANLSRASSLRSTHSLSQPKVSMADVDLKLGDELIDPNSGITDTTQSALLSSTIIYPRQLDISADNSATSEINLLGTGYFCKTVLSQPDPFTGKVFAVKIPKNNAQRSLISHEAYILSLVYQDNDRPPEGIISFHGMVWTRFGYITGISLPGIAMDVYQQTAQRYVSTFDPYSRANNTPISFSDPFIGRNLWIKWANQLINGLLFLQSKSIIHSDIKPDNILLDESLNAYIGDFSSAQTTEEINKPTPDNMSSAAFAIQFSAPELLISPISNSPSPSRPTFATDTFSLGLTLLNFATGTEPYSGAVKHFTQKLIWARKGAALEACSPEDKLRLTTILPILKSFLILRKPLSEIKPQLLNL